MIPLIITIIAIIIILYLCCLLRDSMDKHWVHEKSKKYRIYQVHGHRSRPWMYVLQKRSILEWYTISHKIGKDYETYQEWIKKYNLE